MEDKSREELREAAQLLLEHRWVLRREMPEAYFLVRKHEKKLREFFRDKCGWPLLVNTRFYKLEKIPAEPRSFMGFPEMQSVGDYTLLCCVMAFLEEQDVDGQFLLGDLCEALLSFYPQEDAVEQLSWESYNWRKSLIRIMRFLLDKGILRAVEDESEAFLAKGMTAEGNPEGEALYEVTVLARSFLRSYPKDIKSYEDVRALCGAAMVSDGSEQESEGVRERRQRVYRSLLLEPVFYQQEAGAADFSYLRNQYKRLRGELEEIVDLDLELYQDTAMLVSHDRNAWFQDIFPVRMKGFHDVILHISHALRASEKDLKHLVWSVQEMETFLSNLRAAIGHGWTKELRELGEEKLTRMILEEMKERGMAQQDENGLIHLMPALFRLSGAYPTDYQPEKAKAGGKSGGGE